MKHKLLVATALLLPFFVQAQSPSYFSESILHAQTAEIKNAKVHTCTAVDSTSQGITWGDYFVFDTAGRVIAEDIRSQGVDRSDIRTFVYDTVQHGTMTSTEYINYGGDMDKVKSGPPRTYNRDSIIAKAQPHRWVLYRNSEEIHTIYYTDEGGIETEMKPAYDENDTIREIYWFDRGYVRDKWLYGPDGKLIRDSSFEYYEESLYAFPGDEEMIDDTGATKWQVTVQYYDGFENIVRSRVMSPAGEVEEDDTVLLVYDEKGRCTSSTRKNSKGEITESFTREYDASGNVVKMVNENRVSGSNSMIAVKYVINNTDTTVYRTSSYWLPHEEKFMISYSMSYVSHTKNKMTSRTVSYTTDKAHKIIGDTLVEVQTVTHDKNWRVVNYENRKNGKLTSAGSCEYNSEGKMIKYTRTENGYASTETWSYYPDGTLKENVSGNGIVTSYTPGGKIARVVYPYEKRVYEYTYDAQGLLRKRTIRQNGVIEETLTYQYTFY